MLKLFQDGKQYHSNTHSWSVLALTVAYLQLSVTIDLK